MQNYIIKQIVTYIKLKYIYIVNKYIVKTSYKQFI